MATVLIDDQRFKNIANSIRKMRGTKNLITVDSMPGEIEEIDVGYDIDAKWQRPAEFPDYSQVDISTNILNNKQITKGYLSSTGSTTNVDGWYHTTDYIPVDPNTPYIASSISTGGSGTYFALYDSSKVLTRTILIVANENPKFTTTATERYVRCSMRSINNEINTAQLQKGTVATEYVPYFEGMYFTYDTSTADNSSRFCGFKCTVTGGYKVERGKLVDGQMIVDKTTNVASNSTYFEWLPSTITGYVVYRVTPQTAGNSITSIGMLGAATTNTNNGTSISYYAQPLIERYGRLPRATSFSQWPNKSVVSDTIYDLSALTTLNSYWDTCYSIENIDLTGFRSRPTSLYYAFRYCTALKYLPVQNFVTTACTSLNSVFAYCYALKAIDTSTWDTSNVTTMTYAFESCANLCKLDVSHFNTSKVNTMSYMFDNTLRLRKVDVSNFDTSEVTTMTYMFKNCAAENLDLSNFETSKVTNMAYMFNNTYNLTELDCSSFDTSAVTTMGYMFNNSRSLRKLDIHTFDTSKCTTLGYMFTNCTALTDVSFPVWRLDACTSLYNFMNSCRNVNSISFANEADDEDKVEMVANCLNSSFAYCEALTEIDMSAFYMTNAPDNQTTTFRYCYSLEKVILPETLTSLGTYFFANSQNLKTIVIPCKTVVSLSNANAFGTTSTNKVIYVPDNLVASYGTASVWSTLTGITFAPLSTYED